MIETKIKIIEKRGNGGEDREIRDLDALPVIEFSSPEILMIDSYRSSGRMRTFMKGIILALICWGYFMIYSYYPTFPDWLSCIAVFVGLAGACFLIAALCMWRFKEDTTLCSEGCRGMILRRYIATERLKVGFFHINLKHRYITVRIEDSEDVVNDVICTRRDFRKMRCGGSALVIKQARLLYGYRGV